MEFRRATPDDAAAIREIARRSLEASYSLSPQTIEGAVTQWYDDEPFAERIDDDDVLVVVAEVDDEVVGFSESVLVEKEGGDADLHWLHVDPDYRGEGYAGDLFEETRDRLADLGGERLRGRVLRENPEGNEFYEHYGFVKAGESTVKIDGSTYVENIYLESDPAELNVATTDDGRQVYVDRNDAERGSVAPFYAVYLDEKETERYGLQCANCGSLDIAMDSMGRAECNECGNTRKATRWDAAYM